MTTPVPPQPYTARLEDKLELNQRFVELSFELIKPHRLQFAAGQYVSIQVSDQGERRSYSISSTPDIEHGFKTLVDISPGGLGSQFLSQLQLGQEVQLLAPMGRFTVPADLGVDHLTFVATGSGVSPFRSMIEDQLRNHHDQRQLTLHWGMRHAKDLFWLDEWQELATAFPNFHFHPVLSQAPEEWSLCRGRVTGCLSVHQLPAPTQAAYFLCGSQQMIQDVTSLLLAKQVDQQLILTEKFF